MKKTMFFEKLDEKKVQCRLCPHNCKISDGKKGICAVRENKEGILYSLSYENVNTMHIDPIEKKPLYHFYPGEKAMSIATMGCNLSCRFCQNADLSQTPRITKIHGEKVTPDEIVRATERNDCKIIAYTYSEPTIFYELAYETAVKASKKGIKNVFVSNGYINPKPVKKISPVLDAANIDLKSFRKEFYMDVCGSRLQPVLETIRLMKKLGIWLELTTLLIPGKNDSEQEIKDIAQFIASVDKNIPWHISRFHPDYKMRDSGYTPLEKMNLAFNIGKKTGLNYIYLGNVPSREHNDTICHSCKNHIIRRANFYVKENHIEDGKCGFCKETIPGVFS
ncbi:AmmeMemoRadiSam system radical SAM enzyme [Candidatus Woesearchaeota archaeon]|nr:AmmeMemoRadiSam system radical SAM enzyme [Candidatus Woesearchaeota archaeon]